MTSDVAMMIGGAVVNALAFTMVLFCFRNWAKAMTLEKKARDMTRQPNADQYIAASKFYLDGDFCHNYLHTLYILFLMLQFINRCFV